ncbi:MAG: ammonium transporter, partial [Gammaproteobacteria bacterium PRO9]|nr:ammonium transporter [Gammaproteobacteria bacterium PRO9]
LVAITPACGSVGPMGAIALGLIVAPICFWAITGLKERMGYDDSLDVFGVHCVGGIVGAVLTGVFASESLGGVGLANGRTMLTQVGVQTLGVVITLGWSALVAAASYKIADLWVGLRVTEDHEREGLNTVSHGERAYT